MSDTTIRVLFSQQYKETRNMAGDLAVGEKFKIKGVGGGERVYTAVIDALDVGSGCRGCVFDAKTYPCFFMGCQSSKRKDGEEVYFVEIKNE